MDVMTFKKKLHLVLCVNGGVSDRAIKLMSGSLSYKRKAISEMKRRGLIEKKKSVIRLTRMGVIGSVWRDSLSKTYLDLAEASRKACIKAVDGELRRRLYQSEMLVLMIESGVEIYEGSVANLPGWIVYVRGRQIKAEADGDIQAIRKSRVQGTLFGMGGSLYNMYAMGNGVLAWSHSCEVLYKACTEKVYMDRRRKRCEANAILLVEDIENLQRFMGKRMDKGGPIRAGDVYKKMYLLPKNQTGVELMNIMLLPWSEQVAETLSKEKDAYNFLLPDIAKLRVYAMAKAGREHVCCIKGYEGGLKEVLPEAEIEAVEIGELTDRVLTAGVTA